MRSRPLGHSEALEGRITSGRKIPQVSGIASGWAHWRTFMGRAMLSEREISVRKRSRWLSGRGLARLDAHARRARPTANLTRKTETPASQTNRMMSASLPNSLPKKGEAVLALTIIAGKDPEPDLGAAEVTGLQSAAAAPPSAAECHVGRRKVNTGSASALRMTAAQTWWRSAADRLRRKSVMIQAATRRTVPFTEQAIRRVSAGCELFRKLMVRTSFRSF